MWSQRLSREYSEKIQASMRVFECQESAGTGSGLVSGCALIRYCRLVCCGSTVFLKCVRFAQVWARPHGAVIIATRNGAFCVSRNFCIISTFVNGPILANFLFGDYFSGGD